MGAPAGPAKAAAGPTPHNVGFGERSDRALPPLPPPPEARPFEKYNTTQVVLRAIIVLASLYIVLTIGRSTLSAVKAQACARNPSAPACIPSE